MAKQIKQFRFYNQKSSKNYPSNITMANLASGSIFSSYMPVVQLGIQSLPGTKFYLNNSNDPIIIGQTGIYELTLEGLSEITALEIDRKSLTAINNNINAYLIVDILYEDGVI